MEKIIIASILLIISIFSFFMSIRSFKEKGHLLNNAYIYATQTERETMNKKPYYRQSAIVFLSIGLIFILNTIAVLLNLTWIFYVVIAMVVAVIVYAIVSDILIKK